MISNRMRNIHSNLIYVLAPNFFYMNPYDDITQGQENTTLKPFIPRVTSARSLKGPMPKGWASTNSGVTAFMVEPLSKRAQLLSPSILAQAMFSGPLHWVHGSGFKKGTFWDVFRPWEPCLGMLIEQLLVSKGPSLPSLFSPLSH